MYITNAHRILPRPISGGGGARADTSSDLSIKKNKRSSFGDFTAQTLILTKKNFLVQVRSTTALATQLLIGVIFLGILRLMQLSIETNPVFTKDFLALRDPEVRTISLPARCVSHAWEGGCYSFVATPRDGSSLGMFAADVSKKMATAAGFEGEGINGGYYMFNNTEEVDDWLFKNQNATPVAIHFHSDGSMNSKVSYTLQYNGTRNCNVIGVLDCTEPSFDLMASFQVVQLDLVCSFFSLRSLQLLPLTVSSKCLVEFSGRQPLSIWPNISPDCRSFFFQMLVDQTVLQHLSGVATASIDVGFSDFPHPPGQLEFDVMGEYGPGWLYIAIVLNFVIQLTFVVMEKEKKLRAAMAQMGLSRAAYWISWFLASTVNNVVVVLLLCGFGAAIQMEFFLENGFDVYFTLFFLTATSFSLLAFFFSTLIRSALAAACTCP